MVEDLSKCSFPSNISTVKSKWKRWVSHFIFINSCLLLFFYGINIMIFFYYQKLLFFPCKHWSCYSGAVTLLRVIIFEPHTEFITVWTWRKEQWHSLSFITENCLHYLQGKTSDSWWNRAPRIHRYQNIFSHGYFAKFGCNFKQRKCKLNPSIYWKKCRQGR